MEPFILYLKSIEHFSGLCKSFFQFFSNFLNFFVFLFFASILEQFLSIDRICSLMNLSSKTEVSRSSASAANLSISFRSFRISKENLYLSYMPPANIDTYPCTKINRITAGRTNVRYNFIGRPPGNLIPVPVLASLRK